MMTITTTTTSATTIIDLDRVTPKFIQYRAGYNEHLHLENRDAKDRDFLTKKQISRCSGVLFVTKPVGGGTW